MSVALAQPKNSEKKYFVTTLFSVSDQYLKSKSICFCSCEVVVSSNISVKQAEELHTSVTMFFLE